MLVPSLTTLAALMATIECANILGVFMSPSIKHQVVYQQIWQELSLKGHQVTVVTPDPLHNATLTNLTEINVRFVYDVAAGRSSDSSPYKATEGYYETLDAIAEKLLSSKEFQRLLQDQTKSYDLILIEYVHPVMYGLSHRFRAPVIAVSASEVPSAAYDAVGNPNHPILYPEPILNLTPAQLTLWQKCQSVLFFVWSKVYYHYTVVPNAHEMAKRFFGKDVPYIGDLERNVSMFFVNRNLLLNPPRPNVPAVVEISPIDTKPPRALPNDLKRVLDEAREGVIYIELDVLKSAKFDQERRNILNALSELPYKILWKSDYDGVTPSNVVVRSALSERDLLAHPNVKAFVTEGDIYSVEQAISNQVPLICVTIEQNKPSNVNRVLKLGIGEKIKLNTLTTTKLKNVIVKVAETKSYRSKIKQARSILLDKPMTGLQSAVWWAEYVIRHKGARHMRSFAVDMPLYEYLLLDVISFLILVVTLVPYLMYCALAKMIRKLVGKKKKEEEKEKQN